MKRILNILIFSFLSLSTFGQNYSIPQLVKKWNRAYVPDTVILRKTFEDCKNSANTVTGSGAATRVAIWNGTNSQTSSSILTFSGSTLATRNIALTDTTGLSYLLMNKQTSRPDVTVSPPDHLTFYTDSNSNFSIMNVNGAVTTFSLSGYSERTIDFSQTILQNGNSFVEPMVIGTNNAIDLEIETSGTSRLEVESDGRQWRFTQGVQDENNSTFFRFITAEITNADAGDEILDFEFDLSHTVQRLTGPVDLQRSMSIEPPTFSFIGASTIDTASVVCINAPAIAGTNATITNNYSLLIRKGNTALGGDLQFTTKTINTTAGDDAEINSPTGRFRKDATGDSFTLTNSFITPNSIILLTYASAPGVTGYETIVVAGSGTAVITFTTSGVAGAPAAETDINFLVIN